MPPFLGSGRAPHVPGNLSHHAAAIQGLDLRSSVAGLTYPRDLPLIHSLPNGTSVMLVGPGEPKRGPWTIRDLGPQHHYKPVFDTWPPEMQEREIFEGQDGPYLPYDFHGNAITIEWDEALGRYKHVFTTDPNWINPVANGVRMDAPEHGRRPIVAERARAKALEERDRERERERARMGVGSDAREEGGRHGLDGAADSATPPLMVPRSERSEREERGGHVNGAAGGSGGGFTAANR